jgi:hypothetical protein
VLQPGQMLGLYREENAQEGTRSSAHAGQGEWDLGGPDGRFPWD